MTTLRESINEQFLQPVKSMRQIKALHDLKNFIQKVILREAKKEISNHV